MNKIFLLLLVFVLLILSFFSFSERTEVKIGDTTIKVEVADTREERNRGLSGKKELEAGKGMLFVFEEDGIYGFWMKDMNFSIDIVWIDKEGRVLGVEEGVLPETYPEIFYPPNPVKWVLEVPAGFIKTTELEVGQILSIGQ